jgi:hypothetical protein
MQSVQKLAEGDVQDVKKWLSNDLAAPKRPEKVRNMFLVAASKGRVDICQLMMDAGLMSADDVCRALTISCHQDHLTLAQLLVRRSQFMSLHLTLALADASSQGRTNVVSWLLDEIRLSHDERMKWLLTTASARGDINSVRSLATCSQAGKDDTVVISHALRVACSNGRADVVDWLTMHSTADVNMLGEISIGFSGAMTSLTAACRAGQAGIVKSLLHCVTPHAVNVQCGNRMDSALHYVIWCDTSWWTSPFHRACFHYEIEKVNSLVYTTDVDIQDSAGYTPLHMACQTSDKNIVRLLLSVFASVDVTDDYRQTAMDRAKHFGNDELLPFLSQLVLPSTSSVTRPTVDVIVSDVRIIESDVRSSVQSFAQRDVTNYGQQERQTSETSSSNSRNRRPISFV